MKYHDRDDQLSDDPLLSAQRDQGAGPTISMSPSVTGSGRWQLYDDSDKLWITRDGKVVYLKDRATDCWSDEARALVADANRGVAWQKLLSQ